MYEKWRCRRCETYNDAQDEKCIVCGYPHSAQTDDLNTLNWIGSKPADSGSGVVSGTRAGTESSAPAYGAGAVKPSVGRRSFFRIVLAIFASILTLTMMANSYNAIAVIAVFLVPLILLWKWALKRRRR